MKIGIPAESREQIFDRFYRVQRERSGASTDAEVAGGAGLGLAISRWIAEAHGGRLELAESGPAGSTFAVYLPVEATPT